MTKLEIMNLSRGLSNLYTGLETDLIANIADYLKSGDVGSSTAQWKIQMLARLGALDKANIKTIAEYAGIAPDMLTEVLETAALTAIGELEPGFQQLVKDGIINDSAVPIEKTMSKVLTSYNKQARQSLNMVNTVMRFKAKSAAQKIINDTAELAEKQSFVDMLNKAAGKAVTGAESRQAAMRQCIKDMSEKGIPAFVDKLGREWSPEAYINMDIRTTVSNTANQAQFDRMEAYGLNLVEVSSHSGARPKCAKDQGKIFNLSGGGGYTTDLHGRKIRYYAWSDSSYGEPDGLLGINCGHHIYPFIPGVSYQTYFPTEEKENYEQYMKVQGQRELERRVRKSKRECTALEAVGDTEGLKRASAILQRRQQTLKKYCADNGLSYKADRTAVVGYNKTVAGKTRKALTSAKNNDILKAEKQSDLGIFKNRLQKDKRVSKEYYSTVKNKFSHGSEYAKKAFTKFVPENSVINASFEGTAYYDTLSKKITMHYDSDLHNKRGKCVTYFHEHGHLIDDMAGSISKDSSFRELLFSDVMEYRKKTAYQYGLKTFDKVDSKISSELNNIRRHSAVSDLFDGITKGNIKGCGYHEQSYWQSDEYAITSEAFAHMFEAQFDAIRYNEMKKHFPNALNYFENKLKEAVQ